MTCTGTHHQLKWYAFVFMILTRMFSTGKIQCVWIEVTQRCTRWNRWGIAVGSQRGFRAMFVRVSEDVEMNVESCGRGRSRPPFRSDGVNHYDHIFESCPLVDLENWLNKISYIDIV